MEHWGRGSSVNPSFRAEHSEVEKSFKVATKPFSKISPLRSKWRYPLRFLIEISQSDHSSFRAERSEVEKSFKVAIKPSSKISPFRYRWKSIRYSRNDDTTTDFSIKISPSNHPSFRAECSEVEKSFKVAIKPSSKISPLRSKWRYPLRFLIEISQFNRPSFRAERSEVEKSV